MSETNPISTARGPEQKAVNTPKQPLASDTVPNEVVEYVRKAVEDGEKLPNSSLGNRPPVLRRALIVSLLGIGVGTYVLTNHGHSR